MVIASFASSEENTDFLGSVQTLGMAKARGNRSDLMPKLVFRENGSAKGEEAVIFKESNVS